MHLIRRNVCTYSGLAEAAREEARLKSKWFDILKEGYLIGKAVMGRLHDANRVHD